MSKTTSIEWCDATFNPWIGCTRVSPGCDHCYAAVSTPARTLRIGWGTNKARHRTSQANWAEPRRWNDEHEAFQAQHGRRRRVFCASLADVFDNEVPPIWRAELFDLIKATPNLDWLLLTKRIGNAWKMMADALGVSQASLSLPLPNVWLGATVVNQDEADRDVPKLLTIPAVLRFLSLEPLLGPVDLGRIVLHSGPFVAEASAPTCWQNVERVNIVLDATKPSRKSGRPAIDWVIVGGESGKHARPMHPDWVAYLRKQCEYAGIPFFFKQWGEWLPITHSSLSMRHLYSEMRFVRHKDGSTHSHEDFDPFEASDMEMLRLGKKLTGRVLDGRTHDATPGAVS